MGLLSECKFCHQFFSSAGMADHVRSKHGALIRAKAVLSQFRVQLIAAPAARQQILQPAQTRAPSERPYIRRLSKAEQAQKVRSELQARKNEATAAFIRKSVQQKANVEPLKSVWKEQVAKLSPLKGNLRLSTKARRHEHSYSLQLGRVPARSVPVAPTPPQPLPGSSTGKVTKPRAPATVDVACSCGGDNERCFRCDGRGYYEVSAEKASRMDNATIIAATPAGKGMAGFASDPRGAAYGLREQGRFASAPVHDDFGDDSSS